MITNFSKNLNGVKFEFLTMNIVRLQLFQVLVLHENRKIHFHMQRNGEGNFYITNKDKCPEAYLLLEPELALTILDHDKTMTEGRQ